MRLFSMKVELNPARHKVNSGTGKQDLQPTSSFWEISVPLLGGQTGLKTRLRRITGYAD
jgi:hypothetical protein